MLAMHLYVVIWMMSTYCINFLRNLLIWITSYPTERFQTIHAYNSPCKLDVFNNYIYNDFFVFICKEEYWQYVSIKNSAGNISLFKCKYHIGGDSCIYSPHSIIFYVILRNSFEEGNYTDCTMKFCQIYRSWLGWFSSRIHMFLQQELYLGKTMG